MRMASPAGVARCSFSIRGDRAHECGLLGEFRRIVPNVGEERWDVVGEA